MIFTLAVVCTLTFTPPSDAVTYEFRSRDSDTEVWAARGHTPFGAGTVQVFQTERPVSSEWQVRGCNSGGCAEWSNVCVVRAGQNLYTPDRPLLVYHQPEWQRTRLAKWRLAPFDTARVRVLTQLDVQRAYAQRMLQLFGKWWDPSCSCYKTELP